MLSLISDSVSSFQGVGANYTNYNCCSPYTPNTFNYYSSPPYFPWQIRKVENGFVLTSHGKEYVFGSKKDLSKFLEKELGDE
jgi:hypothetical protein